MPSPYLSVVIPVHNQEYGLRPLLERLYPVLQGMGKPFEIVFSYDASRDKSLEILRLMVDEYPGVKVIELNGSFGQEMAVLAGFERAVGQIVVTLDADLRDPPEEIPRLVAEIERGRDMVGVARQKRRQSFLRGTVSRMATCAATRVTGMRLSDPGCTLRAYHRDLITTINRCREPSTSVPALAHTFSSNPVEIRAFHADRPGGTGSVPLYEFVRFNLDLITGFTVAPLQIFSLCGLALSALSAACALYLLLRRILVGPELEGVFTLFALLFFFIGVIMLGLGMVGEYVGRIHRAVLGRPRFVIRRTYGFDGE